MKFEQPAVRANQQSYARMSPQVYEDGAPHLKHAELRAFYRDIVGGCVAERLSSQAVVTAMDLGAGNGVLTEELLSLGVQVKAVDVSALQLQQLERRCRRFTNRLRIVEGDVQSVLKEDPETYDLIFANSLLHHIPDYLSMVQLAARRVNVGGSFLSFQDPIWYARQSIITRLLTQVGYNIWRISQRDLVGGAMRKFRRIWRGLSPDSYHDNAEYHVLRCGVDEIGIVERLEREGFSCQTIRYFSSQNAIFQHIGKHLRMYNTFSVMAKRVPREHVHE
jgi:SAM-dependent methyltransferase